MKEMYERLGALVADWKRTRCPSTLTISGVFEIRDCRNCPFGISVGIDRDEFGFDSGEGIVLCDVLKRLKFEEEDAK